MQQVEQALAEVLLVAREALVALEMQMEQMVQHTVEQEEDLGLQMPHRVRCCILD
jgi:hypothetical protein